MGRSTATGQALTLIDNLIIGQKLGSCFIEQRIGKGGMAIVYRAIRDSDEEQVAVKVISQDFTETPDFIERFKREAHLMQNLEHPHVLPVYEFGTSGNLMYIVMKLIEGGSLDNMIANGRLPLEITMQLLKQIASALTYAHGQGIIHRDLKPGNVLLDVEGNTYLTDFGIAKWKEETAGLTLTGMVMGTPGYMSPEQWRTEPVDQRTDIYALGVMTFKMLTGRLPFHADTPFSLMYKHLDEVPPLVAEFVPNIIPSIDHVLQRAMAKLPEKRYQTVENFIDAFQDAVDAIENGEVILPDTDDATQLLTDSIAMDGVQNAIDMGARGLRNRIREAMRESQGEHVALAEALLDYVEDLRHRANQEPELIEGPYKALESYDLADNKLFFGRDTAIDGMLDRAPFSKLTILHAESGAGKTSLIRAGLMPRLLAGGYLPLYTAVRVSTPDLALKNLLLHDESKTAGLQAGSLRAYLRAIAKVIGDKREIFIFFDQFETFFTDVIDETARATFIQEIAACIDDETLQVRVILAMRTEYFGMVASFQPAIEQPFNQEFLLRRLKRDEAEQALTLPANEQDYSFEAGLVDDILNDLGDENNAIAPPQLQLVGTALIEGLPEDRKNLTFADYEGAGRARGVLGSYLQRILNKLPAEQRQVARLIIEGLVRQDQTRDVKTAQRLNDELASIGQDTSLLETILHRLRESHVLRLLETSDGPAYELVHDYLAAQVQLDAETAARKAAQELLQRRLGDYERFNSLLTAEELSAIRVHLDTLYISPAAQGLIDQSEKAITQRRRRNRRLVSVAILGVIGALLIGVIFLINESENQREQAELLSVAATENAQSQRQESRRLAEQVFTYLDTDPMIALNLAIEALTPRGRPVVGSAELALSTAIQSVNEELYIRSESQPLGATWTADYTRILVWGTDRQLRMVDATNGVEYANFDAHDGSLLAGAMSRDGTLLLGDSTGQLYRYQYDSNAAELALLETIPAAHNENITDMIWSTTGDFFLVEAQESLGFLVGESGIWENDGTQRVTLSGINPALSTNAELVAIHHYNSPEHPTGSVGVVNTTTGETTTVYAIPDTELQYSRWLDDSTLVSWGNSTASHIWSIDDGTLLHMLDVSVKSIELEDRQGNDHVAVSQNGTQLATIHDNDAQVTVWDALTGEQNYCVSSLTDIKGVNWSPTQAGMLLIYAADRAVVWLDGTEIQPSLPFDDILRDNETIIRGGWSPSGQLAYVWTDNPIPEQPSRVIVWEAATGTLITELIGHTDALRELVWHENEQQILTVGGRDNSTRVWRVISNAERAQFNEIERFTSDESYPATVQWSSDESLVATGYADGTVAVWEIGADTALLFEQGHTASADTLTWRPDNTQLASASDDGTVIVWNLASGEQIFTAEHRIEEQRFEINVAVWRGDGEQLITGGDDGFIRLWDVQTGEQQLALQQTDTPGVNVSSILWNSDESQLLASGDDGSVTLWDATTGEIVRDFPTTDMLITFGVRWNNDESQLLVWGDGLFADTVTVYDVATGELLYELSGHTSPVTSAIWTPDERQIITTSQDQTMRVWTLASANEAGQISSATRVYDVFTDTVYGLDWDEDGRLLTVDRSPGIRIWNLDEGVELFRAVPEGNLRLEDIHWNVAGDRILMATRDLTTDRGAVRILTTQTDTDELLDLALSLRTRPLTSEQRLTLLGE